MVSSFCIDLILFSHSEACTPRAGRLEADLCICIVFLVLFLLSSFFLLSRVVPVLVQHRLLLMFFMLNASALSLCTVAVINLVSF